MAIIEEEGVILGFESVCEACYILEGHPLLILRAFNDLDRVEYELSNNIDIETFEEVKKHYY